jgi:hypothetical protein
VGLLLNAGHRVAAFAAPAAVGLLGVLWMLVFRRRFALATPSTKW